MTTSLLDRLLYVEIGSSFGFGLGLFTVLLVMNHLFYLARLVIGQGLSVHVALVLMFYKIPYFVAFTAPWGVLLATVLGIGRLSDHNEIAALRVAGVSLFRIARPIAMAGVLAALGIIVFQEGIVTLSDEQYGIVLSDVMASAPNNLRPVENVFFQAPTPGGNALYSARRYDPKSRTLEGVAVVYLSQGMPFEIIESEKAQYAQGVEWTFQQGHVYAFSQGTIIATKFATLNVKVPRSPKEFMVPPKQPSDMSLRELSHEIGSLRQQGADVRPYVGAFHAKLATAASCIVFALIALPLSLRPHRSGPSVGLGLSILVLVAYYLIFIPTQLASDGRLLSPVLAAWLPDAVVGAAGVVLLARAAR